MKGETSEYTRQKCEVYSRWQSIVGYLAPVSRWNKGKISEWSQRKNYLIENYENIKTDS